MTPAKTADARLADSTNASAFQFVRDLASALSAGEVNLPSYPQVALRLQKLLNDESTDADLLVRVLGAEPVLAARVIAMANSAAMNPAGRRIVELRTAVVLMVIVSFDRSKSRNSRRS